MKRGRRGHAERNEKEGKRRLDFKYQKRFGMNPRRPSHRTIETSPVEIENTEKNSRGRLRRRRLRGRFVGESRADSFGLAIAGIVAGGGPRVRAFALAPAARKIQ